ncbi:MAG: pyruvoyl-dependent arginine decarboxylase [Methylocystaceae bacterium]
MLPMPKKYFVSAGAAEGKTELTAFDKALLQAGVGNVNMLRVSSILPPDCVYDPGLVLPPGSLVPIAYGYVISEEPGDRIAAAVGVGIKHNSFGVIMEFSGHCTKEEAEAQVTAMVEEAFAVRGLHLDEVKVAAAEHIVEQTGCAFACVPLWY